MKALIGVREQIKSFYAQFSGVILICGKFLLAVFAILFINRQIGFSQVFTSIFAVLVLALAASILPVRFMIAILAIVICGNTFVMGIDILGMTVVLLLLLLLMFVWYVPDDAVEVILMPLAIALGIPAVVPICCGLKRSPASIAALIPGVIMHYYLQALGENADLIMSMESNEIIARIKVMTDALSAERNLIMQIFAVTAVVIIVYAVRKLSADYAWEISVAAGGVLYIVMALISNYALEIGVALGPLLLGTLLSVLIAYVFLFFVAHMDYAASERLTFEDDTYYYYVKAVPKVLRADGPDEAYLENRPYAEEHAEEAASPTIEPPIFGSPEGLPPVAEPTGVLPPLSESQDAIPPNVEL